MKTRVTSIAIAAVMLFSATFVLVGSPVMAQQPLYESVRDCVDAHHNVSDAYKECKPGGKYNPYVDSGSDEPEDSSGSDEPEPTQNTGFNWNWQFIWQFIWALIWG